MVRVNDLRSQYNAAVANGHLLKARSIARRMDRIENDNATEPRTAAGRALEREIGGDYGEDIAAIEAEASGAADVEAVLTAEAVETTNGWCIPVEESGRWYISRNRAALATPPTSGSHEPEGLDVEAVRLLRRLLDSDPFHNANRDNEFLEALSDAADFLATPPPAAPAPERLEGVRRLSAMNPEDEWGDKFYAALEALWRVVEGGEIPAQGTAPHTIMARLIEDVAWRLGPPPAAPAAQTPWNDDERQKMRDLSDAWNAEAEAATPAALDVERLAEAIANEPVLKVLFARFGKFNSVWYEQRAETILARLSSPEAEK